LKKTILIFVTVQPLDVKKHYAAIRSLLRNSSDSSGGTVLQFWGHNTQNSGDTIPISALCKVVYRLGRWF